MTRRDFQANGGHRSATKKNRWSGGCAPPRRLSGPTCPLCGSRRNATDEWCGGNRCLNALSLYMAGKIQSAAPPYDVPETRLRSAEAAR